MARRTAAEHGSPAWVCCVEVERRPARKEDEPAPRTSQSDRARASGLSEFAAAGWILHQSPEVGLSEIRSRRGCLGRADEGSDERTEAAAHHGGPLLLFGDGVARLWWIDGKLRLAIGSWDLRLLASLPAKKDTKACGVIGGNRQSSATFGRSLPLPRRGRGDGKFLKKKEMRSG
ncbi:hypothetical protein STAS_06033 [Striga asiatica]|uniref:Uncharacterized protein n=1 Tax=Striga asiatica TaxID=4170 RepID=A0A5A7PBK4_STRAF|nr:hypothetical protein STAS_06033 [Striga asiatica]